MWVLLAVLLVLLLFAFPRKMSVVLAVTLGVGVISGVFYNVQQRELVAHRKAVKLEVRYDIVACTASRPLLVSIHNLSPLTVSRIEWVFSARRPGYRGELTGPWLNTYSLDGPFAAGAQQSHCYAAPQPGEHALKRESDDPKNLEIGIRSRQISFAP